MSTTAEDHVLVLREGALGRIRLNRPKALNSLTIDMVRTVVAALADFAADDAVAAVLVDGVGERGLCAGGDIRALYESGKAGDGAAEIFFHEEYAMNAQIAAFPKPYIAFMDGITMGGGVGISAHGTHRVVTERTRMAMPETGIGFFPDVGATWLLAHAHGEVGTYLGLTGAGIAGADAIYAGFADIFVPSQKLAEVAAALAAVQPGVTNEEIDTLLEGFAETVPAPLAEHRAVIDKCLAFDDINQILSALGADSSDFAQATIKLIAEKSPTSLILTLRLLRLGRTSASLQDCLDREYFGATRILQGREFYEGVRAAVIDKDRHPKWHPATLAEVDEAALLAEYHLT
jgi:enoyl-CoA hydratase